MVRTRSGRTYGLVQAPTWGRKRARTTVRSRPAIIGPIRRPNYQVKTRYAPHRPQTKIHSLANTRVVSGADNGYGWHVSGVPIGAGFEDRHSDKIKIYSLNFKMQMATSDYGAQAPLYHNVYMFLVKDNSGGTQVPKFNSIVTMDNSNPATAEIDHDSKDRFQIIRRWRFQFKGNATKNGVAYTTGKNRHDFRASVKLNSISEFKSATDGSYANTQKNAYTLYFVPQTFDMLVDGHVTMRYTSIV
uniref:Coat protein n=1 Tax=Capulavirus medicagonis TaxID=1306546 RepID=A0A3S7GRF2_9GEMI|nr:coat protein [Alfalfa leaf curl virus]AVH79874.1 coat protein [Alfalfa leaf curl virus]AVH79902.1 coat protein [Alfalfa leaf curl virus]AVH79937.1 coat protein [Alfalfa leaf curl virus]AVH79965.1 coat protein [Alfalfa leaf curl virus]